MRKRNLIYVYVLMGLTAVVPAQNFYPDNEPVIENKKPYTFEFFKTKEEFLQTFNTLTQKANNGDIQAMLDLGAVCTPKTGGDNHDYRPAVYWYEKACKAGSVQAFKKLAEIYIADGQFERACQLCKSLAEEGFENFQEQYGRALLGLEKADEGLYWIFKSKLSSFETTGQADSYTTAVHFGDYDLCLADLYIQAYEGNPELQFYLSKIIYHEKNVPYCSLVSEFYTDNILSSLGFEKARYWLCRSAEQGFVFAVNEYGCYFPGQEPRILGAETFYRPEKSELPYIKDDLILGEDFSVQKNLQDSGLVRFVGRITNCSLHEVNDAQLKLYLVDQAGASYKQGILLAQSHLEPIASDSDGYLCFYLAVQNIENYLNNMYVTAVLYQNGLCVEVKSSSKIYGEDFYSEEADYKDNFNIDDINAYYTAYLEKLQGQYIEWSLTQSRVDNVAGLKNDRNTTAEDLQLIQDDEFSDRYSYSPDPQQSHIPVADAKDKLPKITGSWNIKLNETDKTLKITGRIDNKTAYVTKPLRYAVFLTSQKFTGEEIKGYCIFTMDLGRLPQNHYFLIDDEAAYKIPPDNSWFVTVFLYEGDKPVSYLSFSGKLKTSWYSKNSLENPTIPIYN